MTSKDESTFARAFAAEMDAAMEDTKRDFNRTAYGGWPALPPLTRRQKLRIRRRRWILTRRERLARRIAPWIEGDW